MLVSGNLVDLDHILTCKRRGSDWVSKTAVQGYLSDSLAIVAYYYQSAGSGNATSTSAPINYNTKVEDTHNAVTTGASWKFTSPKSMCYTVDATAKPNTTGEFSIAVYKNGVFYSMVYNYTSTANYVYSNTVPVAICLKANEYIDIRGMNSFTTSPVNINDSSTAHRNVTTVRIVSTGVYQ